MGLYTELCEGLRAKGWTDGLTPAQIARDREERQDRTALFILALAHDVERILTRRRTA